MVRRVCFALLLAVVGFSCQDLTSEILKKVKLRFEIDLELYSVDLFHRLATTGSASVLPSICVQTLPNFQMGWDF